MQTAHMVSHMVDLDDDFWKASNDWESQLGQRVCPHVFGRGCRVAGSRGQRTAIWRDFRAYFTPAYSPNSRHLFCCHHRCGFSSIASFVGHGHGPLVGRLRALAFSCRPPTEPSPCKVGALQQAKNPCTSTNVIQRTCAD